MTKLSKSDICRRKYPAAGRAHRQALTRPFVLRATPVKISSSTADGIRAVGVDQTLKSRPTGSLPYLASWLSGKGLIVSLSWCKISNNSKAVFADGRVRAEASRKKAVLLQRWRANSFSFRELPTFELSSASQWAKSEISVCEFILELLSSNGFEEKATERKKHNIQLNCLSVSKGGICDRKINRD